MNASFYPSDRICLCCSHDDVYISPNNVALLEMTWILVTSVHMHADLSINTTPRQVDREMEGAGAGERAQEHKRVHYTKREKISKGLTAMQFYIRACRSNQDVIRP